MMSGRAVMTWPAGLGWLVLTGGNDGGGSIRAQALERASAPGGVAYISLADDMGDALMDDMEDLGAPTGYIVDILHEDQETIFQQLHDASIIVIQAGASINTLLEHLAGATLRGIREAYIRGGIILIEGIAATAFGKALLDDDAMVVDGLGWVQQAVLLSGLTSIAEAPFARQILLDEPDSVVIIIGKGSALALGPNGRAEPWGEKQITISLGAAHKPS